LLNPAPEPVGKRQLYSAVISDSEDVLDLRRGGFIDLDWVDTFVRLAQSDGYRWLVFYPDGAWEGRITPEAVYLGVEPVSAEPVTDAGS